MSNATQKIYKKLIEEATQKIVMSISHAAFDITNEVYHDLLISVHDELENCIKRMEHE